MVADGSVVEAHRGSELVGVRGGPDQFLKQATAVGAAPGAEEEVPHQGAEAGAHRVPRSTLPLLISRTPSSVGLGSQNAASPYAAGGNEETE